MGPIFVNATIDEQDLTDYQRWRFLQTPAGQGENRPPLEKRLLIDCLRLTGGHGLFCTDLLRWYLNKGLKVKKIYALYEAVAGRPFKKYIDSVVRDRQAGDDAKIKLKERQEYLEKNRNVLSPATIAAVKQEIFELKDIMSMAERAKVIMNSLYGKTLENINKREEVIFVNGFLASCVEASKPGLKRHIQLDAEGSKFKIRRHKRTLVQNTLLTVGHIVLQKAKLILLMFVYDFIYKFHNPSRVMGIECDTDAYYMAIAGLCLRDILWKEEDFIDDQGSFDTGFGYSSYQDYLDQYAEAESMFLSLSDETKRVPNLFKLEYVGKRMVCLGSKTYAADGGDRTSCLKFSAKGVQANLNKDLLNVETYMNVYNQGGVKLTKHAGFRMSNNLTEKCHSQFDNTRMTTYIGSKIGLNAGNYFKRKAFEDGTTKPHSRYFTVEKGVYFQEEDARRAREIAAAELDNENGDEINEDL